MDEKAVRYRLRRLASGAVDGRREKPFAAGPWSEAIAHWMQTQADRGVNLQALYESLVSEHGYAGSEPRRLCGSAEAPALRRQTAIRTDWNQLWLGSCSVFCWAAYRR